MKTVRVRSVDVDASTLSSLGIRCAPGRSAWIFTNRSRHDEVEAFHPTVFKFRADGFDWVRNGEYVSRQLQRAVATETIGMPEALRRWNVEPRYVDDLDALIVRVKQAGIYCDVQT